jgi:hypothetical protein
MAKTILWSLTAALLLAAAPTLAAEPAKASSATPSAAPEAPAPAPAPPARSTDPPRSEEPKALWETAPALRRAGFTVGLSFGGALGNVTGFPADIKKRTAEFRADTGIGFGGGATLWLGGALTDWLVFGAGLGAAHTQGNGAVVQGMTFVFHTEVFPLFTLGGIFQDLGVGLDTGAGSFTGESESKPAGDAGKLVAPLIESGAASRVGASIFYDGLRLWKVSTGPFVAFDYTWSATLNQPLFLVGLRTALYTKAPKKK